MSARHMGLSRPLLPLLIFALRTDEIPTRQVLVHHDPQRDGADAFDAEPPIARPVAALPVSHARVVLAADTALVVECVEQ